MSVLKGVLENYGYLPGLFAKAKADNQQLVESKPGRVGRVDRGACVVYTERGAIQAVSGSDLSQDEMAPATGDWVLVSEEEGLGYVIDYVLPRRSAIVRRDPATVAVEQTLVANVDVVGVVHGLDRPLKEAQLERFLILAEDSGAKAAIVLNKADLCSSAKVAQAKEECIALAAGVAVAVTSVPPLGASRDLGEGALAGTGALAGKGEELTELAELLGGGDTLALIGASGVGKSSIVAGLLRQSTGTTSPVEIDSAKSLQARDKTNPAKTKSAAAKASHAPEQDTPLKTTPAKATGEDIAIAETGRHGLGRHTTVGRDLYPLSGGSVVIDTPGLRAVGLWAAEEALDRIFSDIFEVSTGCRFRDCTHTAEPECEVKKAVERGDISGERLSRYTRLLKELNDQSEEIKEHERKTQRGHHRKLQSKKVRSKLQKGAPKKHQP